jgi:hypothetical protein
MYTLRAVAFLLFLAQVVLAQQPTPILPDPKLTPGDTFDVTAQDICICLMAVDSFYERETGVNNP